MDFRETRDDQHPIRWEAAGGDEVKYLTLEEAVRRLARSYDEPNAEALQASLMAGNVERTPFAYYQYEDPA